MSEPYGQPSPVPPAQQQPAPYGAPGAYPPPAGQPMVYGHQQTNVLAIVALVGSFFVPIVGIICGHIALGQIKKTGEQGRGLAMAGLIIGYVLTALIILAIIAYILFFVILFAAVSTVPSSYPG